MIFLKTFINFPLIRFIFRYKILDIHLKWYHIGTGINECLLVASLHQNMNLLTWFISGIFAVTWSGRWKQCIIVMALAINDIIIRSFYVQTKSTSVPLLQFILFWFEGCANLLFLQWNVDWEPWCKLWYAFW